MKAYLSFNLNNQSDKEEFKLANQSFEMWQALWDFQEYLRKMSKNGAYTAKNGAQINLTNNQIELLEIIRDNFFETTEDVDLELR